MSERDTPDFESQNSLSEFLKHLPEASSDSGSPTTCSVLLVADNQAISVRLYENDFVELGRFEESSRATVDLSLFIRPEDGVSRRHAILYFVGGRLLIADTGSRNGTYLNGDRLEATRPSEIQNGDCFHLGKLKICVQVEITEHS